MVDSSFSYAIGVDYNSAPLGTEALEIVEISATPMWSSSTKVRCPTPLKDLSADLNRVLPQSKYECGSGVELEVYPSADVSNSNYTCEIWIAVNEKK